ncbi:cytochrome bc complex cytochrome b subunit [Acidobacteriota bacterium]
MKILDWFEDRLGIKEIFGFLTKKEIPVHRHTIWYYTGSAILVFFAIQVTTGILLAFYYKPTLELANASVGYIVNEAPLGWFVRSIHSWSATFMIATLFIHLISIWLTKAYRKPRELTWMSGVFLLVLSLFFGFTGYLLPWDELSLAATKVGTDIPRAIPVVGLWATKMLRGGEDVTGDTLTRFFTFHICVLPIFLILLLAVHVYLIQKHGVSRPLSEDLGKEKTRSLPFWPNFVYRESIVWLILIGVLISIAALLPHHLGTPADLMAPAPEGIKPEWYFLFLFQTLKLFPAKILFINGETLAVLLIGAAVVLFFFLPVIDNKPEKKKGKFITYAAYAALLYALILTVWSLL